MTSSVYDAADAPWALSECQYFVLVDAEKKRKTVLAILYRADRQPQIAIRPEFDDAWLLDWTYVPIIGKPQEYSLPLAEGISTYGKSTYWKTYDGICFINFALKSTQPITNESVIATLPVGFRPSVTVFAGSYGYLEANTGARVAIDVEVRLNGSIVIWTEDPLSNISGFIGFIADS